MELPGPGTIYLSQSLRFRQPVYLEDTVTVKLEVLDKKDKRGFVTLDCKVFNQDDKLVVTGTAEVMAPKEKVSLDYKIMKNMKCKGGEPALMTVKSQDVNPLINNMDVKTAKTKLEKEIMK